MPVEFLTQEQQEIYGKYTGEPTAEQLAIYFLIDDYDKLFILKRKGVHNHLGIALQLCTVRFLGTFLTDLTSVPVNVLNYVSTQLKIDGSEILRYQKSESRLDHTREICNVYGYCNFSEQPTNFRLVRSLYTRAWLSSESPIVLFDIATNRCVEQKILLPGVTTLSRLVAQICERSALRLWKKLSSIPDAEHIQKLSELLNFDKKTRQTGLDNLRNPPTTVSSNGILKALERLELIRSLGACNWNISRLPIGKIRKLSKYTSVARTQSISRMPQNKKIAYLVAFAIIYTSTAQDDVIYILDKLLSELFKRSNSKGDKNKLRTTKSLSSYMRKLLEAFEVLLDDSTSDEKIRDSIFTKVPKSELQQAFNKVNSLTKSLENTVSFHELFQNYSNIRKFLPKLLSMINFQASLSTKSVLEAWEFIKKEEGRKQKKFYKNAATIGMSSNWQSVIVIDNTNKVYACGYTFWVLHKIHQAIKNREIYILNSDEYDDPSSKLLKGKSWDSVKSSILNTTKWSEVATESINPLVIELDDAFKYTASRLPENKYVSFEKFADKEHLVLSPLERREETISYNILRDNVQQLLPKIDLPILVLEVNKWTGFLKAFTHISGGNSRVSDLEISLCAVLVARACNIGLDAVVQKGVPALEYDRLTWIEQNYFRTETIELARVILSKFHFKLPLSQKWGKGEVASADGVRLIVPVKSITPRHNSHFFGTRKGITTYSLISDMFDELNFLLQSGAGKDSCYLPQCVLEQKTILQPKEIMTDTGGYSDLVFGIFGLLEYKFSPRIADVGNSRFWKVDQLADYGQLNCISKNRINLNIIYDNWDDMLKVMGSLKLGAINATNLIRMLQRGGRPTILGRAIIEFGRIHKTLHQLQYIDDPDYRRAILTQLNKGESRNSLTDIVHYGKNGEIYQPHRNGQEEHLGILGLVVNSIVHWNTRYMGLAIDILRKNGMSIHTEDEKHLSPTLSGHINIIGHFSFCLPQELEDGLLRALILPDKLQM